MFKHSEIEHMHRYTAVAPLLSEKVVLDAACGTGYGSNMLAKTAKKVCGIDISNEAIAYAKENFGSTQNVEYQIGNITQIPYPDNTFDVVVSFETIEHINEELQHLFIKEIRRVLKKNGILIMSTPNKEIYTIQQGNRATEWHVKEFMEEEYHDFIQSEFRYVKYFQQYISSASYLTDEAENKVILYNQEKDKKGKFIVAIASDKEIPEDIKLNSVYYYPDEYANLTDICQVYYASTGVEFSEDKCELIEVCGKKGEVEFTLEMEDDGLIGKVRIDPCTKTCAIKNMQMEIIGQDDNKILTINTVNNANATMDGIDWFYHRDPQYILTLEKDTYIKKINVKFQITNYDMDSYFYFHDKIVAANLERKKMEQEQQEMQNNMQEMQNYMQEMQNYMQEMQNNMQEMQSNMQEMQSNMQEMCKKLTYLKNRTLKQIITDYFKRERED